MAEEQHPSEELQRLATEITARVLKEVAESLAASAPEGELASRPQGESNCPEFFVCRGAGTFVCEPNYKCTNFTVGPPPPPPKP